MVWGHSNFHLLSGCLLQVDHYSTVFAALLLTDQSVFGSIDRCRQLVKYIRCSYIQKLMNRFLLFNVGPLLLSVKGIIDLAQMPPTILLPHPGGTGTPTLERIAYLPGAQPPFPPRGFNPTSISPGEDPSWPNPLPSLSHTFLATDFVCHYTSLSAPLLLHTVLKVSFLHPSGAFQLILMYNCFSVVQLSSITKDFLLNYLLAWVLWL